MEMPSSDVTDMISCPICMETQEEPKALPCLHTFCKHCIDLHIRKNLNTGGNVRYFLCPICRKKIHGPKGKEPKDWAENLPHNHLITSLKDSMQEDLRKLACFNHKDKSAEFYCFDHGYFICSTCVLTHRSCVEIDSLENAVQSSLAKDKECDERLKQFAEICRKRQKLLKQTEARSAQVKDKITAWRIQMFEVITDFERTMVEQLEKEITKEMDVLGMDIDECNSQINNIISAKNEHLDPSKPNDIILEGRKVVEEVLVSVDERLLLLAKDCSELKVDFQVDESVTKSFSQRNCFGKLIIQRESFAKSPMKEKSEEIQRSEAQLNPQAKPFVPPLSSEADFETKRRQRRQIQDKGVPKLKQRLNVKTTADRRNCLVTGATFIPDGVLVLCDHDNGKIKFINKELQIVSTMAFNSDPWDVASNSLGEIAVSFPDDNMIIILRVESGKFETRNTIRTQGRCYGLAMNNNKMAVTCRTQQNITVYVIDLKSGATIGSWSTPTSPNGGMWYVAFNADGSLIYVTDDDKGRIVCLSLQGDFMHEIQDVFLQKPRGVTQLKEYVYVAGKDELKASLQQDEFHLDKKLKIAYTPANIISADPFSDRLVLAFNNGDDTDNFCSLLTVS